MFSVQRRSAACGKHSGDGERDSGLARKVFGIAPERRSPSARNRVRDQPGIVFGFIPESRSASPGFPRDAEAFKKCLDNHAYKGGIEADMLQASKIGLRATPAFVIGKSTPDGVDGETLLGAMPYSMFDSRLKELSQVH